MCRKLVYDFINCIDNAVGSECKLIYNIRYFLNKIVIPFNTEHLNKEISSYPPEHWVGKD